MPITTAKDQQFPGDAPDPDPTPDAPSASGPAAVPNASSQDGTYPRPQLMRAAWCSLDGAWKFAQDPTGTAVAPGRSAGVPGPDTTAGEAVGPGAPERITDPREVAFDRRITVPFAPETSASGIGETGPCAVVWYRRRITPDDLARSGHDADRPRVLLHFGAVDHRATVWIDGHLVGTHVGGYAPFTLDITEAVGGRGTGNDRLVGEGGKVPSSTTGWDLVVRAEDPPADPSIPRGKQDWHDEPHAIWYHRQTGIWQTVWIEAVPRVSIARLTLVPDIDDACVDVEAELDAGPVGRHRALTVDLSLDGVSLGSATASGTGPTLQVRVPVAHLRHGQARDEILWAPQTPRLVAATVRLVEGTSGEEPIDVVASYTGLRRIGIQDRRLTINDEPRVLRAILAQNYWPTSGYTAPTPDALRHEVEAILRLGFDCARIHQKAEDPRFLYWADRLGLLVWAEMGNAYQFDTRAVESMVGQWTDLVLRDRSHPSVIVWVPINESWGIQDVRRDRRQQAYARALADLTRALDGTRPVLSNDGWEHTESDLWTIHDYIEDTDELARRYADDDALTRLLDAGPDGRSIVVGRAPGTSSPGDQSGPDRPILLTEFGGLRLAVDDDGTSWGWSTTRTPEEFRERLGAYFAAVRSSTALAGFCYTQLTDTLQEVNGLLTADREPKLPWEEIRTAVQGPE